MLFFLISVILVGFCVTTLTSALMYRGLYNKLRFLALSGSDFKEKKGDLMVRHPLMKEGRWEYLTEAYDFASKPRDPRVELDLKDQNGPEELKAADPNEPASGEYIPGSWKTKENILDDK